MILALSVEASSLGNGSEAQMLTAHDAARLVFWGQRAFLGAGSANDGLTEPHPNHVPWADRSCR